MKDGVEIGVEENWGCRLGGVGIGVRIRVGKSCG